MISTETVERFEVSFRHFMEKVPDVLADMRATAEAKEALDRECDDLRRTLDSLNIALQDLRNDKKVLGERIGQLLRENARLEQLLSHIGQSIKEARPVQDGIAALQSDGIAVLQDRMKRLQAGREGGDRYEDI